MDIRKITDSFAVSPQIAPEDLAEARAAGYRTVICNRPDGEGADQPSFEEIRFEAEKLGLEAVYLPVQSGIVHDEDVAAFAAALERLPRPVMAYCRTGTRSATLWSLAQAGRRPLPGILSATRAAGYDMAGVARRIANGGKTPTESGDASFDVVIVGGGAGGIATAASLHRRKPDLSIAIIDPSVDFSALESLETIGLRLREMGVGLHLSEVKGPVMDRLKSTSFLEHLNGRVFLSQYDAWMALATPAVLRAAEERSGAGRVHPRRKARLPGAGRGRAGAPAEQRLHLLLHPPASR